jgi:hypothetical protein
VKGHALNVSQHFSYLVDGLTLVALNLFFFWRDLTPVLADRLSFRAGDFSGQFYAYAHAWATAFQTGRLPLWNPSPLPGTPFWPTFSRPSSIRPPC